jgi:hypothetical protein
MNGFKLSELNFVAWNMKWFLNRNNVPATSAAVIDDKTLAVAAHVSVVFVDTQTFKRIDSIPMEDTCIGIAYVNNQLVVNCITI